MTLSQDHQDQHEQFESKLAIIIDDLKAIQTEHAQLSELDELEHAHAQTLVSALKTLQARIDSPIALKRESFESIGNPTEVYLLTDPVILMMDEDRKRSSRSLYEFEPQIILSVVKDSATALKRALADKRKEVGIRVKLFERLLGELKVDTIKRKARAPEESDEDDLIRHALASE